VTNKWVGFALGLAIRMWECGKGVEKWEFTSGIECEKFGGEMVYF
jgi:hypothetical protein